MTTKSYFYLAGALTLLLACPLAAEATEIGTQESTTTDEPITADDVETTSESVAFAENWSEPSIPVPSEPVAQNYPDISTQEISDSPPEIADSSSNVTSAISTLETPVPSVTKPPKQNEDGTDVATKTVLTDSMAESATISINHQPHQPPDTTTQLEQIAPTRTPSGVATETISDSPHHVQNIPELNSLYQSDIFETGPSYGELEPVSHTNINPINVTHSSLLKNEVATHLQGLPRLYGELDDEDDIDEEYVLEPSASQVQDELFAEPKEEIEIEDDTQSVSNTLAESSTPRLYGEVEDEILHEFDTDNSLAAHFLESDDEIPKEEIALNSHSKKIVIDSVEENSLVKTYVNASQELQPRLYGEIDAEILSEHEPDLDNLSVDYLEQLSQDDLIALVSFQEPESVDAQANALENDLGTSYSGNSRLAQVTSVDQLSDVSPTDWSYQALRRLIEDYNILRGYPDNTFRGENTVTRYEFASALRQVLDQILELTNSQGNTSDVSSQDLETLGRLSQDFSEELGEIEELGDRIELLEANVAELKANQFSPVVRLAGRVTTGLAFAGGGEPPGRGEVNPVFAHLTQLQLAGSLTGDDVFRIGLEASDFANRGFANPNALNTNMALLGFQSNTNNSVRISSLEYRFPAFDDRVVFTIKPAGFGLTSVLTPNTLYTNSGTGALSRFAAYNPYLRIGNLDAGVGLDALITDRTRLQVAYGVRDSADATQGIFDSGNRVLGVQLLAEPVDNVTTGIGYINAFSKNGRLDTFTGSNNADISGGINGPATIHALTASMQWDVNDDINVGAWFGAAVTDSLPGDALMISSTYLFSLGFPNAFGRRGDLLGFLVGQPPRLRAGVGIERDDPGSGLHYEVFYRHRVNKYFTVTPGFFYVSEPGHLQRNNGIWAAAIRTTFQF